MDSSFVPSKYPFPAYNDFTAPPPREFRVKPVASESVGHRCRCGVFCCYWGLDAGLSFDLRPVRTIKMGKVEIW